MEDTPVKIPENIVVKGRSYSVKVLLNASAPVTNIYKRTGSEWALLRTEQSAQNMHLGKVKLAPCCADHDYKTTPGNEQRFQKWYEFVTKSIDALSLRYTNMSRQDIIYTRTNAKKNIARNSRFTYWAKRQGYV